jgi:hypothetical protein
MFMGKGFDLCSSCTVYDLISGVSFWRFRCVMFSMIQSRKLDDKNAMFISLHLLLWSFARD